MFDNFGELAFLELADGSGKISMIVYVVKSH